MTQNIRERLEFSASICEKTKPLCDPIVRTFGIQIFGYRKFFLDGTSFNTSSNFELTKAIQEKFNDKIISNYEEEVECALKSEKHFALRVGKPNSQDVLLSMLYDMNVWNTLSLYRKNGDSLEGFYFTSTRENYRIVEEYINNIELFERFTLYFKDKFADILSVEDVKKASVSTVSPAIFEEKNEAASQREPYKNFLSDTPIHKLFLNINGKEVKLSMQEFKCLAWLGRGKSVKEIGRIMELSPRTVESYIENAKQKTKAHSRSHLIDLFFLNFHNDKDLLKCIEHKNEKI